MTSISRFRKIQQKSPAIPGSSARSGLPSMISRRRLPRAIDSPLADTRMGCQAMLHIRRSWPNRCTPYGRADFRLAADMEPRDVRDDRNGISCQMAASAKSNNNYACLQQRLVAEICDGDVVFGRQFFRPDGAARRMTRKNIIPVMHLGEFALREFHTCPEHLAAMAHETAPPLPAASPYS